MKVNCKEKTRDFYIPVITVNTDELKQIVQTLDDHAILTIVLEEGDDKDGED